MALRQVIFAIIFGVVIAYSMRYVLGGELAIHLLVAIPAALAGAWFATRNRSGPD